MSLILSTRAGHILTITMNRPEKRNALSVKLMEQLRDALGAAGSDDDVRVVILAAAGTAFCAGLDLAELAGPATTAGGLEDVFIDVVLASLAACPKPTVAMVQGDALAGGCELALHCDLRVAAAAARLGMPVARLGLAAPYPLTLKLVDIIGPAAAKEMLFTGQMVDARRALALGMLNRVVPGADLEAATSALAATIAANGPLAVAAMKQYAQRAEQALTMIPHRDLDAVAGMVRRSADLREGLNARRDGRKPVFHGR